MPTDKVERTVEPDRPLEETLLLGEDGSNPEEYGFKACGGW